MISAISIISSAKIMLIASNVNMLLPATFDEQQPLLLSKELTDTDSVEPKTRTKAQRSKTSHVRRFPLLLHQIIRCADPLPRTWSYISLCMYTPKAHVHIHCLTLHDLPYMTLHVDIYPKWSPDFILAWHLRYKHRLVFFSLHYSSRCSLMRLRLLKDKQLWIRSKRLLRRKARALTWEYLFLLCIYCLGGGFKYFWFSALFGEDSHFDKYFSKGLKPPTSCPKNNHLWKQLGGQQDDSFRPIVLEVPQGLGPWLRHSEKDGMQHINPTKKTT